VSKLGAVGVSVAGGMVAALLLLCGVVLLGMS